MKFKLSDYFRRGSHKVALSLPELVSQTNTFSTKNRPGCVPGLQRSNPKSLYLGYNVKCHLKDSDANGHDVSIQFDLSQVNKETLAKNLDVAVSCTCPAFLYWGGQWNSYQRDALEGEPRPLLTAPTERLDLREDFVICKHIKAVSERILPSVQHNIVKILRQREIEKRKDLDRTPAKLDKGQEQMRDRQKDKGQEQNKQDVRQQLEKGLQKRQPPQTPPQVVKRDTPATPAEKTRVKEIDPVEVPTPSTAQPPVAPSPAIAEPTPAAKAQTPKPEPIPKKKPKKVVTPLDADIDLDEEI